MNLAHMTRWDDDILLKNFMQHLTRTHELKGANGYTSQKHQDNLTKHHIMLKEIKRRMSHES